MILLSFLIPLYAVFVALGFHSRAYKIFLSIPLFTIAIMPIIFNEFGIVIEGFAEQMLMLCALLALSILFLLFIEDMASRNERYYFYLIAPLVLFGAIDVNLGLIMIMAVSIIFVAILFRNVYVLNKILGIITLSACTIILNISIYYKTFSIIALIPMFTAMFYFGIKENQDKIVEKKVDKLDIFGKSKKVGKTFKFIDMLEYQTNSKLQLAIIDDELYVGVRNVYIKIVRNNKVGIHLILNNKKVAAQLVR
ncbi:MAG: hypothetical protein Q6363_003335 [Candidatus Njordarchaeota archaeon]